MRYFGCHVSAAGGLANALRNASVLQVNTIQLHASPPQRWNLEPFPSGVEQEYLQLLPDSGVRKVFFHGIYLINLASADETIFARSQLSLTHALDLMERIGGDGVIFHLGSLKNEVSEEIGFRRAGEAINRVLEKSKGSSRLLLEVAAGSGSIIGDRVEELAQIYEYIANKERVGFALDTQHLWASGYDLVNDLDGLLKIIESVLRFEKVWAIHLNDSKTDLGSRVDRHENIGDGKIGADALRRFFLHKKLSAIPCVLETPSMKELDSAKSEVSKLRRFLREKG